MMAWDNHEADLIHNRNVCVVIATIKILIPLYQKHNEIFQRKMFTQ